MPLNPPALGDAYRQVVVTQGLTSNTTTARAVDAQFNLDAGSGITLVTDVNNNKVTIVNTGNGTGALTTITDNNSSGTFYPIFTRTPDTAITFTAGTIPPNSYVTADVPVGYAEIRITGSSNSPEGVVYELRTALTGLVSGETFQGVKVSDLATLNFTAAGPATYSTIDGYWTIPIDTPNLTAETLSSITIATGTGNYNPLTGTYQMDTMYLDRTTTPLSYNPGSATLTIQHISGIDFTMSGHVTLEGVTSTGATGTGNFVFDNSPTLVTPVLGTPVSGDFSSGTFTWPTFDQNTTGYAANLSGGNNTTLLGSVHYQSDLNVTTQLAPNTTTTKKFLNQTGDGTNGAAPSWSAIATADVPNFYLGTTDITFNRASASQSLTGISIDGSAGSATKSTNLTGGNSTTLLGSIPYQTDVDITTLLSPNTTTTKKFLRQTGDGTNGAAPNWDTVTATDVGLGNVTNESKATMFTDPTFTGHPTIEGVTSTGATGTGKFVFDASPSMSGVTLTGTTTIQQTVEKFTSPSIVANAVTLDFTTGAIFALSSNAANITANFTNIPTTAGQTISVTLIISQGGTAYIPNALTINSVSQTINWLSNAIPTGYANKTDFVSFTFICTATSTYTVTGSLSTYG